MILAADGTASAIAPDGTHRPLNPPGVVGGGEGDHASSHSLPWARWRNGGRGDMAVESEGTSEDLRKSLSKPAPAFRLPTSAFAASACADPCGGDDAGVGGFALSDGSRVAVFAVEETTVAPERKPAPEDDKGGVSVSSSGSRSGCQARGWRRAGQGRGRHGRGRAEDDETGDRGAPP